MAITPNGVNVPAQSKVLDTVTVTTSYGLVHRQVITLADPLNPTTYMSFTGSSIDVNLTNADIAVTIAELPLPDGAASETTLIELNTKTPDLGQAAMAASVPVAIANDQGDIPVSGDFLTDTQLRANPVETKNKGSNFRNINSIATTTVKSGAGILRRIAINTKGAASNTATIYDNIAGSGMVIAVIDTTASISTLEYSLVFSTGLTVVTAAGTAADITVIYE